MMKNSRYQPISTNPHNLLVALLKRTGLSRPARAVLCVLATGLLNTPTQAAEPVIVAPDSGQTKVWQAANGVTVVDINKANNAGLSHNRYTDFNVMEKGLILNNATNAQKTQRSQLAGLVATNPNLDKSALAILNEVISNNRSELNGFTEVLGGRADIILANPYGITCSGCGFINTDHATLTTGKPVFADNGALAGYQVRQGDILIAGTGLNATGTQLLELITSHLRLNGAINAHNLSAVVGHGRFDSQTGALTATDESQQPAKELAIDSSVLGGMYADRIRLIVTDKGAGVRMLGDAAASQQDFTLTATGNIELKNHLSAKNNVQITTTDLALNQASITSGKDTQFTVTNNTTLNGGIISAGENLQIKTTSLVDNAQDKTTTENNLRAAAQDLTIITSQLAEIRGTQWTGANIDLQSGSLLLADNAQFRSKDSLSLKTLSGDLHTGDSVIQAKNDLTLTASGKLFVGQGENQGIQSTDGNIRILAENAMENAGIISAAKSASVTVSGDFTNDGELHANNIDLHVQNKITAAPASDETPAISDTSDTTVATADTAPLPAENHPAVPLAEENTPLLTADNASSLATENNNAPSAAEIPAAVANAALINSGKMLAEQTLTLKALNITNTSKGLLQANQQSDISALSLSNEGDLLLSVRENTQPGMSVKDSAISENNISPENNISTKNNADKQNNFSLQDSISISNDFINRGHVQSAKDLALRAKNITNENSLLADKGLSISAEKTLTNKGDSATVSAGNSLELSATDIDNQDNATFNAADLTLNSSNHINNGGVINAKTGDINLYADQQINNTGNIQAKKDININDSKKTATVNFTNTGKILAGGGLSIAADTVNNSQQQTSEQQNNNSGWIQATTGSHISANSLNNSGNWLLSQANDANSNTNTNTNTNNNTNNNTDLISVANTLINSGILQLTNNGNFTTASLNNSGKILGKGKLTLSSAQNLNTEQGVFQAGSLLDIQSQGKITLGNQALFNAKNLNIQSVGLTNQGKINADNAASTVKIRISGELDNQGEINAGQLLEINGINDNDKALTTLTNSGKLFTGGTLTVHARNISNTSSAWIQATKASQIYAAESLDNQGTLILSRQNNGQTDLLDITENLNNAGTGIIQSAQNITVYADKFINLAGGKLSAANNMEIQTSFDQSGADALANTGKITAGGLLKLLSAGTIHNHKFGKIFAGTLQTLSNSLINENLGLLQGNNGQNILISKGSVNNKGTMTLATDNRASGLIATTSFNNSETGKLQSYAALALNINKDNKLYDSKPIFGDVVFRKSPAEKPADTSSSVVSIHLLDGGEPAIIALSNQGEMLANGDLTITMSDKQHEAYISGTIQSAGALAINAPRGIFLSATKKGDIWLPVTLRGNTVTIKTDNLQLNSKQALITSSGDMTLTTNALRMAADNEKTARIMAATSGTGTGTITVHNTEKDYFTNNALLFSGDTLIINAANLINSNTGGISALKNLTLNINSRYITGSIPVVLSATDDTGYAYYSYPAHIGSLENQGAIYAGNKATINAEYKLSNTDSGTINAGNLLTLTADTLHNERDIVSDGNMVITVRNLDNIIAGGDLREDKEGVVGGWEHIKDYHEYGSALYSYFSDWKKTRVDHQIYTKTDLYTPLIQAASDMQINFSRLNNKGGLLTSNTMNLQGTAKSILTNDSLSLATTTYGFYATYHSVRIGGADGRVKGPYRHKTEAGAPWAYEAGKSNFIVCWKGQSHSNTCSYWGNWWDNKKVISRSTFNALNAGIYAKSLAGKGFELKNLSATENKEGDLAAKLAKMSKEVDPAKLPGNKQPEKPTTSDLPDNKQITSTSPTADTTAAQNAGTVNPITGVQGLSFITANEANGINGTTFGGINIPLPVNPNGLFVTIKKPGSKYLVEMNPLYTSDQYLTPVILPVADTGASTTVPATPAKPIIYSSDYLAEKLNYKPDEIGLRLGDASYENFLVKRQLIAQTGNTLLKGYANANAQMQALFNNAVNESKTLNLQLGQALSPEQQQHLTSDMVWMVQTTINGQVALAPVVYLSKNTQQNIVRGGVISAETANLQLTSLTNSGGTIQGDNLNIQSTGDITNSSGTIASTNNLSLESTEGSIINETQVTGYGDDKSFTTVVGNTGTISSGGNLTLAAGKNIENKGAQMSAGGDASLHADGDILFDTVENKTTTTSYDNNGDATTTTTQKQIKSGLSVGGNLDASAGNDITFAGTDVNVAGNADINATNDLNIIDRVDVTTTDKTEHSSGMFTNGALYSETTTKTHSESGRSVGSTLNIHGNSNLTAGNTLLVRGSDINGDGDGQMNARNIKVEAATEYDNSRVTEETTSILKGSKSSGKNTEAWADTDFYSRAAVKTDAGAKAEGSGAAGLAFWQSDKKTTNTTDLKHKASTVNFGGNAQINATEDVTLVGSKLKADGDVTVNAQNVNVLAAEDKKTTTVTTDSISVGLMGSTDDQAEAHAGAGIDPTGTMLSIDLRAGASVTSNNRLDLVKGKDSYKDTTEITNKQSAIESGKAMTINADNKLTVQGSELASGGDMDLNATDMEFKAAHDSTTVDSHSTEVSTGLYADGKAEAEWWKVEASGEVGIGIRNTSEASHDEETTAVTSGIKAGGNISRHAKNSITDEGIQVEGGGNFTQTAQTYTDKAAANTTSKSSSSNVEDWKVGVGAKAGKSIPGAIAGKIFGGGDSGGADTSGGAENVSTAGAIKNAVVKGAKSPVSYSVTVRKETEEKKSSSDSSTAVTSKFKVKGDFTSTTTGKTTLQGTQVEAGGTAQVHASEKEEKRANSTTSSHKEETSSKQSVAVSTNIFNSGPRWSNGNRLPTDTKTFTGTDVSIKSNVNGNANGNNGQQK